MRSTTAKLVQVGIRSLTLCQAKDSPSYFSPQNATVISQEGCLSSQLSLKVQRDRGGLHPSPANPWRLKIRHPCSVKSLFLTGCLLLQAPPSRHVGQSHLIPLTISLSSLWLVHTPKFLFTSYTEQFHCFTDSRPHPQVSSPKPKTRYQGISLNNNYPFH